MADSNPKPRQPKIKPADDPVVVIRAQQPAREEDADRDRLDIPEPVAVLPVRNMVVFPETVVPLSVGREKSLRLLQEVLPDDRIIVTICQRDEDVDDPGPDDLYTIGTAVSVLKLLRVDKDKQSVIVHGQKRVRVVEWVATEPYMQARVEIVEDTVRGDTETHALIVNTKASARRLVELSPTIPDEALLVIDGIDEPAALSDFLASNLQLPPDTRQDLLETRDVSRRLTVIAAELGKQLDVLELSRKIQDQVKENIDKTQREYFLNEQLKAIQKELGQADERSAEVEEFRAKIDEAKLPEAAHAEALREVDRLGKIPSASPEYNVIRTYLDWMCELPWAVASEDRLDVNRARGVLDEDHYDLDKVKRRILEYLAVRKLAPDSRGPILCFVGPPGVGKTSLGQSIARALGRKFIRMSLGGMRDEAELRGHRRTYIGAMPGRIVQEIRKAGTHNPVFMLDELDKVGQDFRGDPTSALLEVLDPAQNATFQDHYLNVPFDLSKVMFIATANVMGPVPAPLRDRMETIELPGYTRREKVHIATRYLVPRQRKENGLTESQIRWSEKALERIIRQYTREAGVRELERQIGTVCRGVAALVAAGKAKRRTVTDRLIGELLGPRMYQSELALRTSTPGVATGLAYTSVGGEIMFVEATSFPGSGQLVLTGHIGTVMRESAQAAFSLVKSRAASLGIDADRIRAIDVHVHVPAGAVPKDGPSAGVAIYTALTSLLLDKPVRPDVAMTGEITLRGLVLPIGGVKEKVLAAHQAGIHTVILPERNRKDLIDVPEEVRETLDFQFARQVDDALHVAMANRKRKAAKKHKKAAAAKSKKPVARRANAKTKGK